MRMNDDGTARGKISVVIIVCMLVSVVLAALILQLYFSHQRALRELDSLQATSAKLESMHKLSLQVEELRRFTAHNHLSRLAQTEARFLDLYADIQIVMVDLRLVVTAAEHLDLLDQMKEQIDRYRENYLEAISSKRVTQDIINHDLQAVIMTISDQLENSSATDANQSLQLSHLIEIASLNLVAYSYRPDTIDYQSILNSIAFIRQQVESSSIAPQAGASTLESLTEYRQLASQIISQTQNYLYLVNVVLAGLANEYIYLSDRLEESMSEEFALESQIARSELNTARKNTLLLSITLLIVVITSVLVLGYFLYRLAQLEKSLKETSLRHKLIIDQANTGIAEVAPDGHWIAVNQKICELFGYTEAELKSMSWQDITHPDDMATTAALNQQIIDGEINHYTLDKRYIRKDGSFFWARLKVSGHRNKGRELLNFISTIESIDDLKQQESLLLKTNTGLEQQVEERLKELERSNAELEQFAYIASHDLQEPLRMVSSYMQLIEDRYTDKLDDDGKEFIQYAVDGAIRMQILIKSLLEYSRVGSDQGVHETVEMESVLESAKQNLASIIASSQAVITNDELPVVSGNKSQLIQLMQNLISNAIKYSVGDSRPEIHISVSRSGKDNKWQFSVRDNGIGFEPAYAERIFVIFRRLHTKESYAGTGIGLAICKKIIERHGGQIWADSSPGNGSTFHFTLNS